MLQKDPRKWYQKLHDQTMFGPNYRVFLTSEQARTALEGLSIIKGRSWRFSTLTDKLESGLGSLLAVGSTEVVALSGIDNSDILILREFITINRNNVQEYSQLF